MRSCLTILLLTVPLTVGAQERSFVSNSRMILGTETDLTAGLSFVDVDGDLDLDVIYANGRHWPQQNEVYLNEGSGRFTVGYALGPEKATTYAVPTGDLDGDGDADVVVANDMAENWVYLNDGQGAFTRVWSVGPEVEPTRSAQLYDLDGDDDLDVLVTNRGAANGFYLNDGSGRFGPKQEFGDADGSTIAVAAADVDKDQDIDLILANRDGQANQILLNAGDLEFTEVLTFGTGTDETRSVVTGDLNGDGHLDIVAGNIGEPNAVYFGDSSGRFDQGVSFGADERTYATAIADLDWDGDLDIVASNVAGPNAIYFNTAEGSEWTEVWLGDLANNSYGLATADLNGDGYPEIGFANSGAYNRLVFNRAAGSSPAPPEWITGIFEDDYDINYNISADIWHQLPGSRYRVVRWNVAEQYLIAQNHKNNPADPGLWTRIDWLRLEGMAPYEWAFCLTAYKAASPAEAEAAHAPDRTSPRTGCNGYPFSRMKR